MNFKKKYSNLLNLKKQNLDSLSKEALKLIDSTEDPEKWIEAMALCEAAVDEGKVDKNILKLRENMFDGNEIHSGTIFEGEDYSEWFEQLVNFTMKLANFGIGEAWVELSNIYGFTPIPFRDLEKSDEYMKIAVDMDVPSAQLLYGYCLYRDAEEASPDREKGMELMLRAREEICEEADMYLIIAEASSYTDVNAFLQKIEAHNSAVEPEYQLWWLQGDIYLSHFGDPYKAFEYYDRGMADEDNLYCKFKKASLILRGKVKGNIPEAIRMMEEAYAWNMSTAADSLGQFYLSNEEYRDIDKALMWYERGVSYGIAWSMFNLGIFYIYDKNGYTNIDKGLKYLDLAIEENHIESMNEKARFLLEGDEKYRDASQAKKLLERASENGDGYATFRLGAGYQNAEFSEENDYLKAFNYYTIGAEHDYLPAIEALGHFYKNGIAVEQDYKKAVELFRRAIEQGSNFARVELATCYELGHGVEEDERRAFELLQFAAQNNYGYAHGKLGHFYMFGIGCKPDEDKAFKHVSIAIEKGGDGDAMFNMGRLYRYSERYGDPELAIKFLLKAVELNNLEAHIEVGMLYEQGYGSLEADSAKAMSYMSIAANLGHPLAEYKMGIYYFCGLVEKNIEKALEYLYKSYNKGYVQAAVDLGNYFMYNEDKNIDSAEAFQYYKFAVDKNYITEGIGLCYLYGVGVERNEKEAFKYFLIASDNGIAAARYHLGRCYRDEKGTSRNSKKAFKLFTEVAKGEYPEAGYDAGMMLIKGEGIEMDPKQGVEWLRIAADIEHSKAQFELGNCYLVGEGVEEDEAQAIFWYRKAAKNGYEKARLIIGKYGPDDNQ
ncbi:MAG: hypothetical protein LBH60_07855 [Prevotellaceae bacterium]|jgi:TPR repeat protein|nr:hypothetical protein [Prevotellaceae bacterium]